MNNIRSEETTQRTNNIDITMPNFSGEDDEHSKMFLKNLETYITHKKITTMDRMIVIEGKGGQMVQYDKRHNPDRRNILTVIPKTLLFRR